MLYGNVKYRFLKTLIEFNIGAVVPFRNLNGAVTTAKHNKTGIK